MSPTLSAVVCKSLLLENSVPVEHGEILSWMMPNKSLKRDALKGTGNGFTRPLFSLREIRNLDSSCPA